MFHQQKFEAMEVSLTSQISSLQHTLNKISNAFHIFTHSIKVVLHVCPHTDVIQNFPPMQLVHSSTRALKPLSVMMLILYWWHISPFRRSFKITGNSIILIILVHLSNSFPTKIISSTFLTNPKIDYKILFSFNTLLFIAYQHFSIILL